MAGRYDLDHTERKEKIRRIVLTVLFWVLSVSAVVALAYGIVALSIEKTTVVGASMEPTLAEGEHIIIDTLSYRLSEPERFDVIVFRQGDEEHGYYDIKRIIGLPGETVQIIEGAVYIDGELLEETVAVETMLLPGLANTALTLGEGEYFVLGDARNHSEDSRYATVGNVRREEIVGKAWIRTSPFGFVGTLNQKGSKD